VVAQPIDESRDRELIKLREEFEAMRRSLNGAIESRVRDEVGRRIQRASFEIQSKVLEELQKAQEKILDPEKLRAAADAFNRSRHIS
jgi:hypothetical protein